MAITATAVTAAANTTTPTLSFGFTAAAGDLLVIAIGEDGAGTVTWPGSWVELKDEAFTGAIATVAYLIAAGGETSVVPTGTVAERWEGVLWRIPTGEWHGTTAPEINTGVTGSSTAPNPGSITPSWGSATNNIFIAVALRDDSVANTITGYPTNYSTAQLDNNATTSGANTGGAVRIVTGSPEDPGAFTISASETWIAYTIAIRPAAAGTTVTPGPFAIAWTGFAPVVTASDHKLVTPSPFAVAWTGFAPIVTASNHKVVTPSPFALAWTGFAPTVVASNHKVVTPGPFSVVWTGFAPNVQVTTGSDVTVTPNPFALAWTGFAPIVAVTDHKVVTPSPFALAWTGFVPTVTASDHKIVTPSPFAIAWTGFVPTVGTAAPVIGGTPPAFVAARFGSPAGRVLGAVPSGAAGSSRPSGSASNQVPT